MGGLLMFEPHKSSSNSRKIPKPFFQRPQRVLRGHGATALQLRLASARSKGDLSREVPRFTVHWALAKEQIQNLWEWHQCDELGKRLDLTWFHYHFQGFSALFSMGLSYHFRGSTGFNHYWLVFPLGLMGLFWGFGRSVGLCHHGKSTQSDSLVTLSPERLNKQ